MYKKVSYIINFYDLNFQKRNLFYYIETSTSTNNFVENYNPWPGFPFTGKLRPYPQVRNFK